jgi:hypothetical protein
MLMLHEGMTLHPGAVAFTFVLFALLSLSTMFSMVKQRKMGLAGMMFVFAALLVWSAFISASVSA